ncbi:hypothetical protein KYC_04817 [Achromobacter arsenitoxydans SY8]|uniref:Uncharacterized protein n=1 Tax=Achromobacter arsenitoxydans SY8 TaxID=477184 RepID=H0F2H5_9BURK|nr:hypothetical protein KYC_04817 [Achromobacter arsenitoxydans SY8]
MLVMNLNVPGARPIDLDVCARKHVLQDFRGFGGRGGGDAGLTGRLLGQRRDRTALLHTDSISILG